MWIVEPGPDKYTESQYTAAVLEKSNRKTDRSGHYYGQSSQTKESWSKMLLLLLKQ